MFNKIEVSKDDYLDYTNKTIENLSKVNLFIGQNNSGKSRFLRNLFSDNLLQFYPKNKDLIRLSNKREEFLDSLYTKLNIFRSSYNGLANVITSIQSIENIMPLNIMDVEVSIFKSFIDPLKFAGTKIAQTSNSVFKDRDFYIEELNTLIEENVNFFTNYEYTFESIYIPILRGLRNPIKDDKVDYYATRTKTDYFETKEITIENIYSGLSLFNDLTNMLLGAYEERMNVHKFEEFLSINFFEGQRLTLIPNNKADVVYVKIGKDKDRPIYDLGDGIQSIIILTYPLFFRREENLKVYIEEPDLFLHPGMQRILLDTFTDKEIFPNHQFFITTHSNHFLDMTADFNQISVYSFSKNKDKQFDIKNVENGDSDLLNQLGVRNSSVFLSNCTIWVEGITDRIYIRKYLEIYFKEKKLEKLKEDLHFSFVEYGGGNITHWSFLEADDSNHRNINVDTLCSKLFLISDQDGAENNKKAERHSLLQEKLGDRYFCLESREIENLIMPEVLKKVIKTYEKKNAANLSFENWEIENYKKEKIGDFINENVKGLERDGGYAKGKAGTLKGNKVNFAKLAVENTEKFSDLCEETIVLCERLTRFIKLQNK